MKKKAAYRIPSVELIQFECAEVLALSGTGGSGGSGGEGGGSSGGKDENQGEWDPQTINSVY